MTENETRVFIPWEKKSPDSYRSDGIYVTASGVRDVLTSSHLHCTWDTTRSGVVEPCMKPAVAIRVDEELGILSEVCKAHACRVLVPLSFVAQVAATIGQMPCTHPKEHRRMRGWTEVCGLCGQGREVN